MLVRPGSCSRLAPLGWTRGVAQVRSDHAEASAFPGSDPPHALLARRLPSPLMGLVDTAWTRQE
jgi:hypothetical protein